MAITIRELALRLNLSITTVSRALDGHTDVSAATRQRVIDAAKEIGYVPSFAARQLRRKRADSFGYILPTSSPQFSDPFYVNFLAGLCDEIASQKLDLLVTSCSPNSDIEKEQYQRWVQSRRVDGIVLNRVRLQDWRIEYLLNNNVPFVTLGKSNRSGDYPSVEVDDDQGMKKLIAHLVQKGHRQIGFIGASPELVIHSDRFRGYRLGLETAGIAYNPNLCIEGDLTETGGYQAAISLLDHQPQPTAIIGINDLTALGALQAAKDRGFYIATELAIAGYDGIKDTEFTNPPITTLHQPTYEIARQLACMLVKLVEGEAPENLQVKVQPELIIRASTG